MRVADVEREFGAERGLVCQVDGIGQESAAALTQVVRQTQNLPVAGIGDRIGYGSCGAILLKSREVRKVAISDCQRVRRLPL